MLTPQSETRNPQSKGFTLIEIVITIVLVSILAGLAGMIILQGARAYTSGETRSDVHYQARLAVERIAREVRHIRSCSASDLTVPGNPSNTLSFTDVKGNSVSFSVSGGNLLRGTDPLASGITTTYPFSFLASDGTTTTACPGIWFIDIDVTDTQGSETTRIRSRVHPRNF